MPSLATRAGAVPSGDGNWLPDAPIDYSIPYESRQKNASRHFGFFPFFAKKPWPVVQEYIKHYTAPGDLVCDPFAGSGVTLVEALVLGRRAIGTDINPVARFIARTTAVAPVDLARLRAAYEQVRQQAQRPIEAIDVMSEAAVAKLLDTLDYPRESIPSTVRRGGAETVNQLHTPRQLAALTILRDVIRKVDDNLARDLLRVALANTVRYANRTYSGRGKEASGSQYRGNAGFLHRFSFSLASSDLFYEHHVWPTFERSFKAVIDAKEETNRLIGESFNESSFRLARVPAWRIHEVTGEGAVDYCFTDPPYSNDIHFLDLSTLWASWLDLPIDTEARRDELLIGGTQHKSRPQFAQDFAAAMESVARALKDDHWFTLIYKHRDLSLWQTIVAACEEHGLRYVNAIWQDVKIKSTRQIESPDINPQGDMYLNFRKMVERKFNAIYGITPVINLPTHANYVEHEVERCIVSYLSAEIELIVSSVIQQVLASRAFRTYRENPKAVADDVSQVLRGPRFSQWELKPGKPTWVMAPGANIDPSLNAADRLRYYAFDFLRQHGEATEREITEYLLTRFAQEPEAGHVPSDISWLLRTIAHQAAPHRWRFDEARVTDYKQLRLLFQPSQADVIREQLERRTPAVAGQPLRPDLEGIALLRDRLREANSANRQFESQCARLMEVLQTVLLRLMSAYSDDIERVMAVGDWAVDGIDLRGVAFDEIAIQIILRASERLFEYYRQIAADVFVDLDDTDIVVQFDLQALPEWQRAVEAAQVVGREAALGIPLLSR